MRELSKEETGQDFVAGKRKKQNLPSVQWFADNGTPIKKLNLCAKDLEGMPEGDKDVVALSTQAVAGRRLTVMVALLGALCLMVALEIVCAALYAYSAAVWEEFGDWLAWSDWTVTAVIAALAGAVVLVGAVLAPWCHKALKGFLSIDGGERLGASRAYQRTLKAFCRLSYVWGIIGITAQSLAQKKKVGGIGRPLQVTVPANCGFDDWINKFGAKEKVKKISVPTKEENEVRVNADDKKEELMEICAKVRVGKLWYDPYAPRRSATSYVKKTSDLYPNVKWFKKNGTPIKEIRLPYEVIENMSEAELDMVSVSTFALVERRIKLINCFAIMLGIWLLVTIIGAIVTTCASADIGLTLIILGLIFFFGNLLTGSAFMMFCYRIFTAFLYIDGDSRLMLDLINYRRKVKIYEKISFVWGCVGILVLAYAGGLKYADSKYIPHVGMPENCGFDNLIALSERTEQVTIDALLNALQEKSNERTHERYLENIAKLTDEINADKALLEKDKEKLKSRIQEESEKEKEKYDEAQSSFAEHNEQDIRPAYEALRQETLESGEALSATARREVAAVNAQVVDFIAYGGRERFGEEAAEKRAYTVSVCLAVAAVLGIIGGIIAFFVTYDDWTFWQYWGFVLLPLLCAAAFAVAGIIVYIKTDGRTVFRLVSAVIAAIFACCLLLVSIMAIYENAGAFGDNGEGDGSGGFNPPSVSDDYGDLIYEEWYDDYGNPIIIVTGCQSEVRNLVIPSQIEGKPVTIGYDAFAECESLISVTVRGGVEYIGYEAFRGCVNLESVTIEYGVTGIDSEAFSYCTSLTFVYLPETLIYIETGVFEECINLNEINFNGTRARWAQIDGAIWLIESRKIICTDGIVSVETEMPEGHE